MSLVNFSINQIKSFLECMMCIDKLLSTVDIIFNKDGFRITDVNKTTKIVIDIDFKASMLKNYIYNHDEPTLKIGVSIDNIIKAIKSNLQYNKLTFDITKNKVFKLILESTIRDETNTNIVELTTNKKSSNINIDYPDNLSVVSINSTIISKIIKDLNQTSDQTQIVFNNNFACINGIVNIDGKDTVISNRKFKYNNKCISKENPSNFIQNSVNLKTTSLMILTKCIHLFETCYFKYDNDNFIIEYPISSYGTFKIIFI